MPNAKGVGINDVLYGERGTFAVLDDDVVINDMWKLEQT